jgi:hypothetical protein
MPSALGVQAAGDCGNRPAGTNTEHRKLKTKPEIPALK